MDPLSITAAAVGCLEAGLEASSALKKIIKTWRSATPAILALNNEVSDLLVVLDQTRSCQEFLVARQRDVDKKGRLHGDDQFTTALAQQLRKAYEQLEELSQFVHDIDRLGSIRKKNKWLFKHHEAATLQNKLRDIRVRITDLLVTYNASAVSRVELQLHAIHTDVQRSFASIQNGTQNISFESHNIAITQQNTILDAVNVDDDDQYSDSTTIVNESVTGPVFAEGALTKRAIPDGPIISHTRSPSLIQRARAKAREHAEAALRSSGAVMATGSSLPIFTSVDAISGLDPTETPTVGLSMRHRQSKCLVDCTCSCHDANKPRTRLRSTFLGTLFVGYSGFPWQGPDCNRLSCLERGRRSIDVTYMFPTAYLQWVLTAVIQMSVFGGPQVSLSIRRRSPYAMTGIFHAALLCDMPMLHRILRIEPGAVNDRLEIDGRNVLQMAVARAAPISLMMVLLRAGASVDQEDDFGRTAASLATEFVLTSQQDKEHLEFYASTFPLAAHIEALDLTHLQKVILGISPGDAVKILQTRSPTMLAQINQRDESGRSALHRAVACSLPEVVLELLAAGADPDECFMDNTRPLHRALDVVDSEASDQMCAALIAHGADICKVDHHGWSPMLWAARRNRLNTMKLLVERGASVHDRQTKDNHPWVLAISCTKNGSDCTSYLLEQGADPNAMDDDGTIPIFDAIYYDTGACIRTLLYGGSDYFHIWEDQQQTLLHFAAQMATVKGLEILAEHGLYGIDVARRDKNGYTADDLFAERAETTKELKEAWRVLLWKIENAGPRKIMPIARSRDGLGLGPGIGKGGDDGLGSEPEPEPESPVVFHAADLPPPYILDEEVDGEDVWYEALEEIIEEVTCL